MYLKRFKAGALNLNKFNKHKMYAWKRGWHQSLDTSQEMEFEMLVSPNASSILKLNALHSTYVSILTHKFAETTIVNRVL